MYLRQFTLRSLQHGEVPLLLCNAHRHKCSRHSPASLCEIHLLYCSSGSAGLYHISAAVFELYDPWFEYTLHQRSAGNGPPLEICFILPHSEHTDIMSSAMRTHVCHRWVLTPRRNRLHFIFGAEGSWKIVKKKLHGLNPRANYTDRATAACRRSDCQLLWREGACGQRDGSLRPYSRFSRQEPLLFYQVVPQLYSRGRVDSVPDPLLCFC
jgi:hypothetical protein